MYIDKYWGNYIGGSDDSLNLVAFLVDQGKEEIPLNEIFSKIGLDRQNWDFHQTMEYLEFTHSDGVEMDFHFAIDVVTDLAAILLECSVSGSVNLQDLDKYNTPSRRIRITATVEEHNAMDRTLADFAQNPLSYDLHEMMDDEEILEMACDVEALRKELYESAGRNRSFHVKAEDMKNLLPDWDGANGCIATNRITARVTSTWMTPTTRGSTASTPSATTIPTSSRCCIRPPPAPSSGMRTACSSRSKTGNQNRGQINERPLPIRK